MRGRTAAIAGIVALALLAPGCAARRARADREKAAEFLVAQDVYDRAQVELARRNLRKARQALEKIRFSAEDRQRLEPLVRIALADAMFYLADDLSLIEARAKYQDFVILYTNHPLAPYAGFQAGICSLKQARSPSRDQSQTLLAIADLRDVVRRWPDARFAVAAKDAIAQAEATLAEHEFLIGRFYLQKKKYPAAVARFRSVLDAYPRFRSKEKVYFGLGQALHLSDNPAEGLTWFERLFADYPEGKYAAAARKFLAEPPPKKKANVPLPEPPAEAPATTDSPAEGRGGA